MIYLLWTLLIAGAINTLFCLIYRFKNPMTVNSRIIDAIYSASLGCWALWLLARLS